VKRKLKGKADPSIVAVARPHTTMEVAFPWTQYPGSIEPRNAD
jgi:hypothetical protein